MDEPIYSVDSKKEGGGWLIRSHVRDRAIKPGSAIGTQEEINEAFITLCEMASTARHTQFLVDRISTNLKHPCYELSRWDLMPKKLLLSSMIDEEELQGDTFEVTGIRNVSTLPFAWSCELEITRYPMESKTAFVFAEPKYCGITHPVPGGQCMALRSTCVIQMNLQ